MKDSITIVGMDVHKDSISIALAETGDTREVRSYAGTLARLERSDHGQAPGLAMLLSSRVLNLPFVDPVYQQIVTY